MKVFGIAIILLVLVAYSNCNPLAEDQAVPVTETIQADTSQVEKQPTLELNMDPDTREEKTEDAKLEQEMKGQPAENVVVLKAVQEVEIPAEIAEELKADDGERESRMHIASDIDLSAEDITEILQKLGFPVDDVNRPQSRGVIGRESELDEDFYVVAFAPSKIPLLGKELFAIDHTDEARYKKSWKRYLRKAYRKLRRTTKKYKRKGTWKSNDLTVENVIRKIINKKQEEEGLGLLFG